MRKRETEEGMEHAAAATETGRDRRLAPSLDDAARTAVMRAGLRLFREGDPFYRALGLTGLQYNVLRVLEEAAAALPQQEIARRVFASRANVTSLLDQLEAKGLVERMSCADRRVKLIRPTRKALDMLEGSYAEIRALSARLMSGLTAGEKRGLLLLLERLGEA